MMLSMIQQRLPRALKRATVLSTSRHTPRHSRRWLSTSSSPPAPASPSLFTWGTNQKGNVLLISSSNNKDAEAAALTGSSSIVKDPTKVVELDDIVDVADIRSVVCGPTDTAVITKDGSLFVCGTNKHGQLGLGHVDPVLTLTKVPLNDDISVAKISLGMVSAAIIDENGDLYTAGSNGTVVSGLGMLGLGGNTDGVTSFSRVESLVEDGCFAKDAAWGDSHLTVLTTEGEILTCGAANYGRLGTGDTSADQWYLEPVLDVGLGLTDTSGVAIAGGKSFTLALNKDGIIYGWGRNHKGQLGTGFGMAVDMYAMEETPQPVNDPNISNHELATSGQKVVKIAAGPNHAAAITETGALFWWGMAAHLEPARATALAHENVIDVSCGNDVTLALTETGRVYAWGKNGRTGVWGVGANPPTTEHQPMLMPASNKDLKFTSISVGWKHAAGMAEVRQEEEKVEQEETI